ncbi:MAG TPA: hypothetical protein VGC55_10605 [Dokdonella sp.]
MSYHVVWSEALDSGTTLQLSADLNPAAVGGGQAVSAPTLSWPALAGLTWALGALAWQRRWRSSAGQPFACVSAWRPSSSCRGAIGRSSRTSLYVHVRCKAA